MARRTKEEAMATRGRILDAAERLFHAQGVSQTSLHDIASAAGVTRGAVYWHFQDKGDLFNAMLERVRLPMEAAGTALGADSLAPTLPTLRAQLLDIFVRITGDAQVRRVAEITFQKIEYVDEMNAVREHRLQVRRQYQARLERTLQLGQQRGEVVTTHTAQQLAIGLHALLDGLLQNWMLDPAYDLRSVGAMAVEVHLAGLAAR
jgi:TetR/AcrR family transcriptional regulator, acrAB operon repressor